MSASRISHRWRRAGKIALLALVAIVSAPILVVLMIGNAGGRR